MTEIQGDLFGAVAPVEASPPPKGGTLLLVRAGETFLNNWGNVDTYLFTNAIGERIYRDVRGYRYKMENGFKRYERRTGKRCESFAFKGESLDVKWRIT